MKKVLFVFAAMALAVALTPAAFANTVSVMTFQCASGNYYGAGQLVSSPAGTTCVGNTNPTTHPIVNTWTQDATNSAVDKYTLAAFGGSGTTEKINGSNNIPGVTASGGTNTYYSLEYNSNQGFSLGANYPANLPANGVGAVGTPNLSGATSGKSYQFRLTYNAAPFYLLDFYVGDTNGSTLDYQVFAYDGSTMVYCIAPNSANAANGVTCSAGTSTTLPTNNNGHTEYYLVSTGSDSGIRVTDVVIDEYASGNPYLDNIVLENAPEPGALVLLGTGFGLMGLALFLRKRSAGARSAMNQPTIA